MANQTEVKVNVRFVVEGDIKDRSVDALISNIDKEVEKLVRKIERRYQNVVCPNYAKVEASNVESVSP